MKLHLFKYTCNQCGAVYKAPEVNTDSYGEFLMRSPAGELAYLNAIEDPIYSEVDELLKKIPKLQGLSPVQLARIQRKIFGEACDTDASGNKYGIETKPICQTCGNQVPSYWEATEPPEFVHLEIPPITHTNWLQLSEQRKLTLLESVINV